MDTGAVMTEIAGVLAGVDGIDRCTPHPPDKINAPAAFLGAPDRINFDLTGGRGTDQIEALPLVLVAGKPNDRSAWARAHGWASGGPGGVKAAMEAHTWASCDDVHVSECYFDVVPIADVDQLCLLFSADVIGPGEG